jgi:Ca2+-binding RTX toxin-like protein
MATINGTSGNNTLTGGTGNDRILPGNGNDTINGLGGIDTLDYSSYGSNTANPSKPGGIDASFFSAGGGTVFSLSNSGFPKSDTFSGIEKLIATKYNDELYGSDNNENFSGGGGNDKIYGSGGNDWLSGNSGNDLMTGGLGNDTIYGGTGKDNIDGGTGKDWIKGGTGGDRINSGVAPGSTDRIVYGSIKESTVDIATRDIINFEKGLVKIDLEQIDLNSKVAGDQDFRYFIGTKGFTGRAGEIRYALDQRDIEGVPSTAIFGDVNGDKKADFAISIIGQRAFSLSDFDL